jgi:hypothetical protein
MVQESEKSKISVPAWVDYHEISVPGYVLCDLFLVDT